MIGQEIKPELEELIENISKRNGYYGNKISPSIMRMFEVEVRDDGAGILVPYWLGVLQKGRGPRRSNKDSGLVKIIYRWMQKRNMFRSATAKGKMNEAKGMTWYINKYGNAHFKSKVFVDVFDTERKKTIKKIDDKFGILIGKITMDVI
ncbi:MAG TPA: hypothetical protein VMV77_08800 [Bacteroidales bacterium]|nr:hypothetical protein [Bacteroidales bacterium]